MDNQDQLEELIKTIETAELTDEVIQWMEEIAKPEAKLIESLINCFKEKADTDQEKCRSILHSLQYKKLDS